MLRKIVLTMAAGAAAACAFLPTAASAQGYGYSAPQGYYQSGYEDRRGWGDRDRWAQRERWHREEDRRRYWEHERYEHRRWHDDGYGY